MEHEALDAFVVSNMSGRTGVDAYSYGLYQQNTFPYITNRIGPGILGGSETDLQRGEGQALRTFTVIIRVIIGHFSSGYVGEKEELLNEMMPVLRIYLEKRLMLTTDAGTYTDWPEWIDSEGVIVDDTSGIEIFSDGGIGTMQVGEEITLLVPVLDTLNES
jgi:hypothetical protein